MSTEPQTTAESAAPTPDRIDSLLGVDAVTEPTPAAEPDPAPAPEPKPEPVRAEPEKRDTMVPHGALHEERERRKRAEAQLEQLQRTLLDRVGPQQPQQPQIPNRDQAPVEHFDARLTPVEQELQQFRQWRVQQEQQARQTQEIQALTQTYQAQSQEYATKNPDFMDAYNFLTEQRIGELEDIGWPRARAQQIAAENELAIVAKAFQDGVNPAERIYNIAKRRGFSSKPKDAARAETVERGQRAQGLGGAAAAPPDTGQMTPERIASMSNAEFDKWFDNQFTPRSHRH